MSCPDTPRLEGNFLLGALAERDAVHLQDCSDCTAQLGGLQALAEQLGAHRAPATFADQVMARLETPRARRRWPWALLVLAALVLLGLGALTLITGLTGAPAASPGRAEPRAVIPEVRPLPVQPHAEDPRLALELPRRLRVGDCLAAVLVLTVAGNLPLQVSTHVEGSAFDLRPSALQWTPSGQELPLTVTARETGTATLVASVRIGPDTLKLRREVEVEPAGSLVELVSNLSLAGLETRLRAELHPGCAELERPGSLALRLIPGVVAEAGLSLRGLVRSPHGCFEQTSAATFPSLLVLAIASERAEPDSQLIALARAQAEAGAQRLERFQMPDGGFTLHGKGSTDPWLTAFGLRELVALDDYLELDSLRINAARTALLGFQQPDGGFPAAPGGPDQVAFSAYALHALQLAGADPHAIGRGSAWLESRLRQKAVTPYGLVLSARFLLEQPDRGGLIEDLVGQLLSYAQRDEQGLFWPAETTWTRSSPQAARVELTALAAQVLQLSGRLNAAAEARTWLIEQRTSRGFGGTQATVQTLAAFRLADGVLSPVRGLLEVAIAGRVLAEIEVEPDVLVEYELEIPGLGPQQTLALARQRGVELFFRGSGVLQAQLAARGYLSAQRALALGQGAHEQMPPALLVRVGRPPAIEGQSLAWHVQVENQLNVEVNNPMLELDLPGGFRLDGAGGLDELLADGTLQHWELWGDGLVLYLQDLAPHQSLNLTVRLLPGLSGDFLAGAARAYPYYRPEEAGLGLETRVSVAPADSFVEPAPGQEPTPELPDGSGEGPVERQPETVDRTPEVLVGSEELPDVKELSIAWGDELPDLASSDLLLGGNGPLTRLVGRALSAGLPECALEVIELEPDRSWNVILKLASWSDGQPITADDFVRSWEASRNRLHLEGDAYVCPDTVQLRLLEQLEFEVLAFNMLALRTPEPQRDLMARLGEFPFLLLPEFNRAELSSTGPYRVESSGEDELLLRARDPELELQRVRIRPAEAFEDAPADLRWKLPPNGVLVWTERSGWQPLIPPYIDDLRLEHERPIPTAVQGALGQQNLESVRRLFRFKRVTLDFEPDEGTTPELVLISAEGVPCLWPGKQTELPQNPYDQQLFVRWPLKLP